MFGLHTFINDPVDDQQVVHLQLHASYRPVLDGFVLLIEIVEEPRTVMSAVTVTCVSYISMQAEVGRHTSLSQD